MVIALHSMNLHAMVYNDSWKEIYKKLDQPINIRGGADNPSNIRF